MPRGISQNVVRCGVLAGWGVGLLGCQTDLPGQVIGTYQIRVQLVANECGSSAVFTNNGRTYAVELRGDGDKGYWHVPKVPPLEGSLSADAFRFTYESIVASSPSDASVPIGSAATVKCTLTQAEVLEGHIRPRSDAGTADAEVADATVASSADADADAGAKPLTHDLEATHVLTIAPAAGANCATALMPIGAFAKLPCTVSYALTGTTRSPL